METSDFLSIDQPNEVTSPTNIKLSRWKTGDNGSVMQAGESAQILVTYGSAQAVTPVACGWTRASRNHRNPKRTLQSPQSLPRWMTSHAVHTDAAWRCRALFGHQNDARERGDRRSFSYRHPLPPGSPAPRDLSSPQPVNPPIHLSLNRRSAHPGLAALA